MLPMLSACAILSLLQDPAARSLPEPTRLTHVVNAYGSFSPDGTRIVYQGNAAGRFDLYVTSLDGSEARAIVASPANDITPVYSPDGEAILFVSERDGQREVYVCAANGERQRRLTHHEGHDLHPVWSPAGDRILFSSNRGNASADDYDLYTMDVQGGDLVRITSGPDVDTYASWSPDGTRIVTRRVLAGTSNNEVFVLDADGSNPRNLTNDPLSYDGWPVWSPDGARIAFAAGPPGRAPHRVYLVRPDGSRRVALTGPWGPGGWVYDTQPSFAPDGRRLVFTRYGPTLRESAELFVVDVPPLG